MNRLFAILALPLFLFPSLPSCAATHHKPPSAAQSQDITVWVNTSTHVFHLPGTRWYKRTKHGVLMSEREALAKGYRPAYNGQ